MADLHVHRDRLEIRLTRAEKALAFRKDDLLVIPRERIRSVAITQDPWIWIRGVRVPGMGIPLTLAIGTWKYHGGKDFLIVKGKSRPAVVIDIEQPEDGTEGEVVADGYDRVIVSTAHATALMQALRAESRRDAEQEQPAASPTAGQPAASPTAGPAEGPTAEQ
ncbi:hypothetical protein [Gryllotalpicola ginsengisoli]|uniref:hypothetical protein n=1 Tax=Gryllotalpicola ginsengisoli TaxID=444608 RepID=UPI0003B416D1|nr:hypothetical protein [Gryllotalpicola ginsengisoli]